jgi:hypothetical protein
MTANNESLACNNCLRDIRPGNLAESRIDSRHRRYDLCCECAANGLTFAAVRVRGGPVLSFRVAPIDEGIRP